MHDTQFNTLVQMIAALSARMESINEENHRLFATKKDMERFATKEDLERFATKDDLQRFATKEDLRQATDIILNAVEVPYLQLEKAHLSLRKRVTKLEKLTKRVV